MVDSRVQTHNPSLLGGLVFSTTKPQLMLFSLLLQDKVDQADVFPDVLGRVEKWLQDHQLGAEKSFAVLTDG